MTLHESILDYLKVCGYAEKTELAEVFKVHQGWLTVQLQDLQARHLVIFDGKTITPGPYLKKVWQEEAQYPTTPTRKKDLKPRVRKV
jgi:hypothetical protein